MKTGLTNNTPLSTYGTRKIQYDVYIVHISTSARGIFERKSGTCGNSIKDYY